VVVATLRTSTQGRAFAAIGGILFVASLLYFLGSYLAFTVSPAPSTGHTWRAIGLDVLLFSIFALHHSVFARTGIRAAVMSRVSEPLERATYVWVASLLFVVTVWAWQPVPGVFWNLESPWSLILRTGFVVGLYLTAAAAAALDPLELAGIRQAFGWPLRKRGLITTGPFGVVRHPIYLGWVLLVFSVPAMTGTSLIFAVISTVYLVVAVPFEERELRRTMGEAYEQYSRAVRWRMIPGVY
jgi:methanethiol S-methyltransferase